MASKSEYSEKDRVDYSLSWSRDEATLGASFSGKAAKKATPYVVGACLLTTTAVFGAVMYGASTSSTEKKAVSN